MNSQDNLKDLLADLAELRRRAENACEASKELREKHRAIIDRTREKIRTTKLQLKQCPPGPPTINVFPSHAPSPTKSEINLRLSRH